MQYAGIAKNVMIQLAPRIKIIKDIYVTAEVGMVMLIGNDIFNSEVVRVETVMANKQAWVVSWEAEHDIIPYSL